MTATSLCPCGSGLSPAACCEPIIAGELSAPTAEALMRARYSAHVTGAYDYLEKSLFSGVREKTDTARMRQWSEAVEWKGLEVHSTEGGGESDETGAVSFSAHYSVNGVDQEMREDATFVREEGEWRYMDGSVHGHTPYRRENPKTGRNDPCPCGSGKKHKKCCGAQ